MPATVSKDVDDESLPQVDHDALRRGRALADPSRRRILWQLAQHDRGLGISDLADSLSLHANTVRFHLGVLERSKLVASHPAARGGRGRPHLVYELADDASDGDGHVLAMADLLSAALGALDPAQLRALDDVTRNAGAERIATTGQMAPTGAPPSVATVRDRLLALLTRDGFAPRAAEQAAPANADERGVTIDMHACPYLSLARAHPAIVCRAHRGVLAGALAALGLADAEVELQPFVRPGVCSVRIST